MKLAVIAAGVPAFRMLALFQLPLIAGIVYVGGLRGKPVDLTKCETLDMLVPAQAEIVLEGEVLPKVRVDEGKTNGRAFANHVEQRAGLACGHPGPT